MWVYDKKVEFPIKIKTPNPKLAKLIITQYGGPYCIRCKRRKSLCAKDYRNYLRLVLDEKSSDKNRDNSFVFSLICSLDGWFTTSIV
jgi:hypothetical protein